MATKYALLAAEIIRTTDDAVCVFIEGEEPPDRWIPRSVCEDGDSIEVGDEELYVARWFLDRQGL